ncbi:MAG: formylmethanofuran dehydrogenase subunit C [Planctomycetales bacterium]|nr:formylmethanofuran dehydrogenase subunit C [Planctomycetales bacterium]
MNGLTLTREMDHQPQRLDLRDVVPERLLGLPLDAIRQFPILANGQPARLGDYLSVSEGPPQQLILRGELSRCDRIGSGMTSGDLLVVGDVGDFLASPMRGGRLLLQGSAGRYAASSLRSGMVQIQGNVGEYAAAALPTAGRGMSGGTLHIGGNCGPWVAAHMRRGTVMVLGDIEAGGASGMIAGTLVVAGKVAMPLGCGMTRGSLLLLQPSAVLAEQGPDGFTRPQDCELSFLPLLLREIARHLPPALSQELPRSRWKRCLGDRAAGGQGEVLLREAPPARPPSSMAHA